MDVAISLNISDNVVFFVACTIIAVNVAQSFFTRRKR